MTARSSSSNPIIAITGGAGFLGRALELAADALRLLVPLRPLFTTFSVDHVLPVRPLRSGARYG